MNLTNSIQHSVLLLVDNESLTNKCLLLPLCLEFFWSRPRCTRRRPRLATQSCRGTAPAPRPWQAAQHAAFSPFIQEQNVWSIYLLETTKNTNCYLSRILNSSSSILQHSRLSTPNNDFYPDQIFIIVGCLFQKYV